MNIICLFHTWPYPCIWLRNINIFGARARHIRIMGIVRLGYHGSTDTIREVAKNSEESISEWLVQVIGERENTRPPENKKRGKEIKKQEEQIRHPQKEKGEKSNTEKRRRRKIAQLQKKKEKKKGVKRKEKKRSKQLHSKRKRRKKGMKKRKIRRYLLIYVCHSLIYE